MCVEQNLNHINLYNAIERSLAIIIFDAQGNILQANGHFSSVIGYGMDVLKTMHHRQLCLDEFTGSREYEAFWDNLRHNKAYHDKVKRVHQDGHILFLDATYTPVLNDLGQVESVIKIATDVTNQETVIRNSSDEFMALVEEMTAYTNEVHGAFQQIIGEMEHLKGESKTMGESVKRIEFMATSVKKIAGQSNILGLNASIEAARAGEHGKGFAVVAQEVRKMSDTSKQSAEDISAQLEQINTYVSSMTHMVDHVTSHVHKNSVAIAELRNAYEQVMATAEKLSAIVQ